MVGLFIGSTANGAGKSLLSVALGVLLQKRGFSVGFMKPLGQYPRQEAERHGDADALVIQEALGQHVPADVLTPAMLPSSLHTLSILKDTTALTRIQEAYATIAEGKDVTLVCGTGRFPFAGTCFQADGIRLIRELGLKAILVERFRGSVEHDALVSLRQILGDALLGVVLNDVPEKHHRDISNLLCPYLEARGVPVLGLVPPEPGLTAMRISELARMLSGVIVAGNARASNFVEGYIIGTMQVDNFMTFLRTRKKSDAVIVGGDRADLQIAALHSGCCCLVLTGNISPCELVRTLAEEKGAPVILVRPDTFTVARSMEGILRNKKMRDLKQLRLAVDVVSASLDLGRIIDTLTV